MIFAFLYILSIAIANLLAATFIELPVFGMLAVGTLFFGATFTLRDYIHQYGRRFVYKTIGVALLVNVLMAAITKTPYRIILASFIAIAIAETTDTEVFQSLRRKSWAMRSLGSNLISIPLDTILFTLIAFYGDLSNSDIMSLVYGDTLTKFAIATILILFYRKSSSIQVTT